MSALSIVYGLIALVLVVAAYDLLQDEHGPMRMIECMIRVGPYGDKFGANPDGLNLEKLRGMDQGIDLGPLQANRLPDCMPMDRIDLCPEYILGDIVDRSLQRLLHRRDTPETDPRRTRYAAEEWESVGCRCRRNRCGPRM